MTTKLTPPRPRRSKSEIEADFEHMREKHLAEKQERTAKEVKNVSLREAVALEQAELGRRHKINIAQKDAERDRLLSERLIKTLQETAARQAEEIKNFTAGGDRAQSD